MRFKPRVFYTFLRGFKMNGETSMGSAQMGKEEIFQDDFMEFLQIETLDAFASLKESNEIGPKVVDALPIITKQDFELKKATEQSENKENVHPNALVSKLCEHDTHNIYTTSNLDHEQLSILSIMFLEKLEMYFYERQINADHRKLKLLKLVFKNPKMHNWLERFDTFRRFKADFLKVHWERINIQGTSCASWKFLYIPESEVEIGARKILLVKFLFWDSLNFNHLSIEEAARKFNDLISVNIAYVIERATFETTGVQIDTNKPFPNTTPTESADVNMPPTCKACCKCADCNKSTEQAESENKESELALKLREQTPLDRYNTLSSLRSLLLLEKMEGRCSEESIINTDHAELSLIRLELKDPINFTTYRTQFDTYSSFKADFLNAHWTRINAGACIHKTYFESLKRSYLAESQCDFRDRKYLIAKHLYPSMSIEEAAEKIYIMLLSIELAYVKLRTETRGNQSQNATAAESADVKVLSTFQDSDFAIPVLQEKSEISKLVSNLNEPKISFRYNISWSIHCLLLLEKIELCCNESKLNADSAKLILIRQVLNCHVQSDYLNMFGTFTSFKADFLNRHLTNINSEAGVNKTCFESFKRSYLAESEGDFSDRKFLLAKHLYPELSIQEAVDNFIVVDRDKLAFAIRRAVPETSGVEIDTEPVNDQTKFVNIAPVTVAELLKSATPSQLNHLSELDEAAQNSNQTIDANVPAPTLSGTSNKVSYENVEPHQVYEQEGEDIFYWLSKTRLSENIRLLLLLERLEFFLMLKKINSDLMKLISVRDTLITYNLIVNPEKFKSFLKFKKKFANKHWSLINATAQVKNKNTFSSFRRLYVAELHLKIETRKFLLTKHLPGHVLGKLFGDWM